MKKNKRMLLKLKMSRAIHPIVFISPTFPMAGAGDKKFKLGKGPKMLRRSYNDKLTEGKAWLCRTHL
jgi:hypothetical protein